jgi:hypothetical protein
MDGGVAIRRVKTAGRRQEATSSYGHSLSLALSDRVPDGKIVDSPVGGASWR